MSEPFDRPSRIPLPLGSSGGLNRLRWVGRRWLWLWLLCFVVGCWQTGSPTPRENEAAAPDDKSAEAILLQMQVAYNTATHYHDQARLYLSYRLQDQYIQEQQPWSVRWQRDVGFVAAQFNAEISHDGRQLSCFVFDNDTANLDQQQLLVSEPMSAAVARILQDPIARHYVAGFAELPLASSESGSLQPLVNPVLGLLGLSGPWELLTNPNSLRRLDDALVDGQACYHLQLQRGSMIADLWIDRAQGLLRQMTLPTDLLDERVRQSPDITEIQFFARMHGAEFALPEKEATFAIRVPRDARALQQFVAIPQVFPCEGVGQPMVTASLMDSSHRSLNWQPQPGRVTLVLWVGDDLQFQSFQWSPAFQEWHRQGNLQYALVYSDDHLVDPTNSRSPPALLERWIAQQSFPGELWYDPQLQCYQANRLHTLPAALMIGPSGIIEYAINLNDERALEKLEGAVARVLAGESIATEMIGDYQNYLARYQRKLDLVKAVSADSTTGSIETPAPALSVREVFRTTSLSRPGNLYVPQDSAPWYAIDGWRTIVAGNEQGQIVQKFQPNLPPGAAIDRLRWNPLPATVETHGAVAAFSALGSAVYLLDSQWQVLRTVLAPSGSPGVLDCQFIERDGAISLVANFEKVGLCVWSSASSTWETIAAGDVDAFGVSGQELRLVRGGKLWGWDWQTKQESPLEVADSTVHYVYRIKGLNQTSPTARWITNEIDTRGVWLSRMNAFDRATLNRVETQSQLFEDPIENIQTNFSGEPSQISIAVASRQGVIHLWNQRSEQLGRIELGSELRGLSLLAVDGNRLILTSVDGAIIGWQVTGGQ